MSGAFSDGFSDGFDVDEGVGSVETTPPQGSMAAMSLASVPASDYVSASAQLVRAPELTAATLSPARLPELSPVRPQLQPVRTP